MPSGFSILLLTIASELIVYSTATSPVYFGSSELLPTVNLDNGAAVHRLKRQQMNPQPIRVTEFYQSSVDQNLNSAKNSMIRNEIIPDLKAFLSRTLSVQRSTGPVLINNNCSSGTFFPLNDGNIACTGQCQPTFCGQVQVPAEHLRQCRQCNDQTVTNPNAQCGSTGQAGPGVDTDYILYVSADQSKCPAATGNTGSQTVALAAACQMESTLDRPVAGVINFCPDGLAAQSGLSAFTLVKHEILHALAFSSSLFPFWRDSSGNPRTARTSTGLPQFSDGRFQIGPSTIRAETYNDWVTFSQTLSHTVNIMVTPRVVEEARNHFNCPTLPGVELENQGGTGTALSHWEKRILGNEAMTGILSFNGVFSRITYAALEDSGWYTVNYESAEPLVYGRGAGCRFAMGSCREWINTQQGNSLPVSPFCDIPQNQQNQRLDCTFDRAAVAKCNLATYTTALDEDFRFFSNPAQGGSIQIADFCPTNEPFNFVQSDGAMIGTQCSNTSNAPSFNSRLESFGSGSRCVNHGTQWTANGQNVNYGAGCYQYTCSANNGVRIRVGSNLYQCSCEGEEISIDIRQSNIRYQGSIICPSCSQICHDDLGSCPSSEQRCYGRQTSGATAIVSGTIPDDDDDGAVTNSMSLFGTCVAFLLASIVNLQLNM